MAAISRQQVIADAQKATTGTSQFNTPYTKTTTTAPSTDITNLTESGSTAQREFLSQQNMTPEALAQLNNLIKILEGGGTPEQRAADARRRQVQSLTEQLLSQVSTGAAMNDAEAMMALQLQQAMEKSMPAISKAIEGAGTSASSMQGVLSQQAARDAALASGALGGQLAAQYAGQRSSLANILEALTRPTNEVTSSLLKALETSKGAVTNRQTQTFGSTSGTRQQVTDIGKTSSTDTYTPDTEAGAKKATAADEFSAGFTPSYWSTNTNQSWQQSGVPLSEFLKNPSF
ncbi:MAG: hypothetical protein ACD_86C00004G0003 [uncultured bacterium]|nr:MAG: hypothetical protein ACD_86C00004G0003 [uncultured bacterium]